MRAEAAVPDGDAPLRREREGREPGLEPGDRERHHPDMIGHVPEELEDADARHRGEAGDERLTQRRLVRDPARLIEGRELGERAGEREHPDRVGGSGLMPVGAAAPHRHRRVARHDDGVDRAAAREMRSRRVEPVPAADERPDPERRVRLVPRERHVVDAGGGEVEPPVRHELRPVDREPCAGRVREPREAIERQHLPGHVRCARHRQQRGP